VQRSAGQLRRDALQIWQAGVNAVRSYRLVQRSLRVAGRNLEIGTQAIPLDSVRRIAVVGAGKAGAGMAEGVENALGPELMAEKQLTGWVNVPADCVRTLQRIHLHAARPAGVNEPRPEGVAGVEEILRIVSSLGPDDLCLCLISGGGSALMPAPVEGISLADKLAVTRHLSAAGANIEQLNAVRKQLSRIKGGGLLRACTAGRLVSLIISDVLGDPLDVIASGPTVPDSSTPRDALAVLERFDARTAGISPAVFDYLSFSGRVYAARDPGVDAGAKREVLNLVIGNNATAVAAAAGEAKRLGYAVISESATQSEGPTEEVGRRLADTALRSASNREQPTCLISGGEPVVKLVDASRRGLGGRNQQLVLAALLQLANHGAKGVALLSGGTDGEDGPTDAAGAFCDAEVFADAHRRGLDPADFLARNDAYNFFLPLDALVKTGPTHTNVCDVRVVLTA
jgi:glycerate 2-kinase